jgi:hypothetical protein
VLANSAIFLKSGLFSCTTRTRPTLQHPRGALFVARDQAQHIIRESPGIGILYMWRELLTAQRSNSTVSRRRKTRPVIEIDLGTTGIHSLALRCDLPPALRIKNRPGASSTLGWSEVLPSPIASQPSRRLCMKSCRHRSQRTFVRQPDGHTSRTSARTVLVSMTVEPNAVYECLQTR